mmetsp:Transcript_10547/g.23744  ORF Transcript_10547/g.23744 Transcript_10547/m.23744 type:complete len:565 (+) Transcript_10547:93-1787(+)
MMSLSFLRMLTFVVAIHAATSLENQAGVAELLGSKIGDLGQELVSGFEGSSLMLLQVSASISEGLAGGPRRVLTASPSAYLRLAVNSSKFNGTWSPVVPRSNVADWKTGRNRLTFMHIPKNAGTAVEEAGAKFKIWWPRKWLSFWHGVEMPDHSFCEKYHVPPQYLEAVGDSDAKVYADSGTFCVTRHPYDRAVSEYSYMLSVPWGPGMSVTHGTGLLERPRCSEEGLNHFIQKAMRKVLAGNKFMHDCHMVPQSEFIWGKDGKLWCQNILRSEDFPLAFDQLMERNDYAARLEVNKTNNSTETCPHLSRASLSLDTKRMLDTVYEDDFSKLNYTKDQKDVVLVTIPRNAAKEMELAASAQSLDWPRNWTRFKDRVQLPDISWCNKHQVPPQYLEPEDAGLLEESETFCATWHPYSRALSMYLDVMEARDGFKMADAYGVGKLDKNKKCEAYQLNTFLERTINTMLQRGPFLLDCGMIPQVDYIWGSDGRQWCDTVLRVEDFPTSFNEFMTTKGYPAVQIKQASSNSSSDSSCPNLTVDSLYNTTKELLQTVYKMDFEKLGYSF